MDRLTIRTPIASWLVGLRKLHELNVRMLTFVRYRIEKHLKGGIYLNQRSFLVKGIE